MKDDQRYPLDFGSLSPTLQEVITSAAKLQEIVPDAVLVGGSAAALYAGHRDSFDHGHVLQDLAERYGMVIDAVEASEGWATSVRASKPPFTVLGSLDGVEAGLRHLRRSRPLETVEFELGGGHSVVVPTFAETLRIKAYLVVQRNAVRDYLDVAALTDTIGVGSAAGILRDIDHYYLDRSEDDESVLSELILKLAAITPRDPEVIPDLATYKGLVERWHDWSQVEGVCSDLSQELAVA
jgi:hypothetical protein